jgi:Glu-tRNA(Gln) amidotransferase subunit E-like FAD-binding protein
MIKFDYNTKNLYEAVGMTQLELEDLSERLADKSYEMHRENLSKGDVAQFLAESLSYTEMLYMCTSLLIKETKDTEEKMRSMHSSTSSDLGQFLEKLAGLPQGFKTSEGTIKAIDMSKMSKEEIEKVVEGLPKDAKQVKPENLGDFLKLLMGDKKEKREQSFDELKASLKKLRDKLEDQSNNSSDKDE